MRFDTDQIIFGPDDVDLSRSPLRASLNALGAETFVLGAFNPALTRLPNGNLAMFVRVAEALSTSIKDGAVHMIRWAKGGYAIDGYNLDQLDLSDPRTFKLRTHFYPTMGLTSLSWILAVELSPDGRRVIAVHYDKAIAPSATYQEYGIEDARVSLIDGVYYMTVCSVSAERHGTTLYISRNGLDYEPRGLVLDHQNKDMLFFEGRIGGQFWALTRPLGSLYFLYPPDSVFHAGPSINLATSPDGLHWKPNDAPFIRPRKDRATALKVGGGAQPIRTPRGWLILYHGVEPQGAVGIYRTFWALADEGNPALLLRNEDQAPLLESNPRQHLEDKRYLHNVVFTTGIVDAGDHYIVASGEDDLACRITHIPKSTFD
jgi:predicted GH43/DUF377 family glycosyl hydrolase